MAETQANSEEPRQLASVIAYLGRLENQLDKMMELLLRQETRIGRIEHEVGEAKRDIVEVKSDAKMLKNTMVSATSEILSLVMRIDDRQRRLQKAEA